ncbi:DciA family protein [Streptomyces sp. NPDC059994]|uniref:DciA family protein n=1 Tax=Streptomyces sp. NPDC059994 TaxID=3347029 RepID=UPI00368B99C8
MALSRPGWFPERDAWWAEALGTEVAGHLEPLGIDEEGRLHLRCADPAWARQTTVLSDVITARLNTALATRGSSFAGIVVTPTAQH